MMPSNHFVVVCRSASNRKELVSIQKENIVSVNLTRYCIVNSSLREGDSVVYRSGRRLKRGIVVSLRTRLVGHKMAALTQKRTFVDDDPSCDYKRPDASAYSAPPNKMPKNEQTREQSGLEIGED